MRIPTLRALAGISAAVLTAATVTVLAGPAHGLSCFDSADCAATSAGLLPFQDGPELEEPAELLVLGDKLLVRNSTAATGQEIWRTDLTQPGTALVKDINPGSGSGFAPGETAVLGNYLYFAGDNGVDGVELWRTDGTVAGTSMFKETRTGPDSSEPSFLTVAGGKLYWQAYTGGVWHLWVTDGTQAGTARVTELGGAVTAAFDGVPVPAGGKVYFVGLSGGIKHLAVTDGTAAGTKLLTQFAGGIEWFSYPRFLDADHRVLATSANVFFTADGGIGHGRELWTSDGTVAGTREVVDLTPGSGDSTLRPVGPWGGGFYFYNAGPTEQYKVYRATSTTATYAGWSTSNVTDLLGADGDAFYFARSIGLSTADVVRAQATGAASLETGSSVQSIPGGALYGDTFFVSTVVQGAGDQVMAFDAATGDLGAATPRTSSIYREPVVFAGQLVVPASDNAGPWHLVSRALGPVQPQVANPVAPSILGTVRVGLAVTVRSGTWTDGAMLGYQWLRGGVPIAGATGATYTPATADLGKELAVAVTGAKPGHVSLTRTSATRVVARGVLTAPKPKVVGIAKVGRRLRTVPGSWTSGTRLTYRWYVGRRPIAGAGGKAYRIKSTDRGKRLSVRVTGVKAGYATVTTRSVRTRSVRR